MKSIENCFLSIFYALFFSFFCNSCYPRKRKNPMADWSQLPKELLGLIAERLNSPFYQLRFRSVCSSWRSSFSPRPLLRLPGRFPFIQGDGITDSTWGFHLSRRTIFLIRSPDARSQTPPNSSWLVKVEEIHPSRMRLLNPLSRVQLKPLPTSFPNAMDLTYFNVLELGQEYVLPFGDSFGDLGNLYMEKVAFMSLGCGEINEEFLLLTIHVSGKLAFFKSGDKRWTIIDDMPSYDDVILFQREFYAVDDTGRTVLLGLSLDVSLVAESVYGGDKKFLVESNGELLLVDMYLSEGYVDVGDGFDIDVYEVFDEYVGERTVRFKVFRLDIEGKRWVEVDSLRDQVLFLGDDCAFSASMAELSLSGCIKGNCVLFPDNFFYMRGEGGSSVSDGVFKGPDICVFDLDNDSIALLGDCPEYSRLFWPPPDLVVLTNLTVQNQFEELSF
ncbi:F-box protein SKIP23-like isoform X2 [Alnus glutinosa]|uniref:F-box protein SKIP23-like isoform X2 n=1 Tax=Alnus glutinosa TaxID=3517 RepID=UPI002D78B619|nr:F-box protein SKIP23-like isoform X2 [Alnus glutinosa]